MRIEISRPHLYSLTPDAEGVRAVLACASRLLQPAQIWDRHRNRNTEIRMSIKHRIIVLLAAGLAMSAPAWAQSSGREPGPEYGLDVVYYPAADWSFNGGSSVSLEDDVALTLIFGYRFSSRLEVQGALDWQSASYKGTIASANNPPIASIDVRGDYESWTPRVAVNFNLLDRNLTPYITGGIGWTFVDTNIPTGQVSVGCWWDPWYGQICTGYQATRTFNEFSYQVGAGIRWDSPGAYSLRLGYEKHWLDISTSTGTPSLDLWKVGVIIRY
jgi:opacity protein-like surface antigen